jgi:adenosylcobinamide-GDP ribazoletransferase
VISQEWRRLATALTFLTRLPWVHRFSSAEPTELARATRYFPLVGMWLGALLALLFWALAQVVAPFAALVTVALAALATGAFHEDGFADALDGMGGSFDRARKLEIMKDSRLGTYGSLGLVLLILSKWQAWQALEGLDLLSLVVSVALIFGLARLSSLDLIRQLPYVREGSSNKPVAETTLWSDYTIAWLSVLPLAAYLGWVGLAALLCYALTVFLLRGLFFRQIGGITGDCLGMANQVVEVSLLGLLASC